MKTLIMLILNFILFLFSIHTFAYGEKTRPSRHDVNVNGYYKSNGTYVQPHYRSNSDGDKSNNWSTRGNINPYTGKFGTK